MNIKNYKIDQKTRPIEWILKNRNFKIFLNCIIKQKNNKIYIYYKIQIKGELNDNFIFT